MDNNNGLEVTSRVLPLVLARGEIELTMPLQSILAARADEYDEPALSVSDVKARALSGELYVELTVLQESYYVVAGTGLVEKETTRHRLSQLLGVPDIGPKDLVEIDAEAVSLGSWRAARSNEKDREAITLSGECKLKINYVVFDQDQLAFYMRAGETDPTVVAEPMEVECFCGSTRDTFDITLPVEFGSIPKNMGEIQGSFVNAKATALPGYVRLEGDVTVTVPYSDQAGNKQWESFVHPVRRYLEFPGASHGMLAEADCSVEIFTCRRQSQSSTGQIRGLFHAGVRLSKVEGLEIATQMRSHSHHGSKTKPFLLEEVIAFGSSQTLIQREIIFSRPARKVREPVDATVRNLRHEIIPNKVIVRGVLHKQIFAVDAVTGAVFAEDVDEAFVHFVDVPGASPGMRAHVSARVEFVSVEIRPGGETARQVTVIEIKVKITKFIKKEIVSPIFPPAKPVFPKPETVSPFPKPTGTVYVVRSGDSVWKIARMFGVSMESIIAANNLQNPNLIFPGQKLVIPGR